MFLFSNAHNHGVKESMNEDWKSPYNLKIDSPLNKQVINP